MVAKTGLQFHNKRVTIQVRYRASLAGLALNQEITKTAVRQISVTPPAREEIP
jgi:hypothetical protein